MYFKSRNYLLLLRAREGRALAELSLTHADDTGTNSLTYNPNVLGQENIFHVVYQGDYAIDLRDNPQLIAVSLAQKSGAQALVGEYLKDVKLDSGNLDVAISLVDCKQRLPIDGIAVFQPRDVLVTSPDPLPENPDTHWTDIHSASSLAEPRDVLTPFCQ